ncbi:anaerobic selenocysteine-containing dehydrogenase [Litorivivens lipolytica]|uniref:Anaerobic selenocysteine-containing dehydrogenase n=1 Tax=Litorivivens lipolytica TaxID=1524264 RepID=A0A7W4W445_9GAMM|nr:molybdopterin-dependent oxidoreductase [Litorivivens lipolytica]MBB3046980.1 anaerobic selenocysteine-containing dehydrogenase [Litorivivens lipolytica]
MSETKTTFCRICENQCGLVVTVDNNQITHVEPDTEHVASKGFACIKGLSIEKMRTTPDRLTTPLKKTATGFEPISWKQALSEIGEKIRQLRGDHGDESVGAYFGNPISFSPLMPIFWTAFTQGLNTHKTYNTGSLDCNNKFLVSQHLYGSPMALTFPDVDKLNCLIMIGANPAISKMSFINLPDPVRRLQAVEQRGGKVFNINPRRTETAKAVGEQVFIRPDTDVFMLLGFLHEVLAREAVDRQRIDAHMTGFDQLQSLCAEWAPERQAEVTGISASALRELVDAYLKADGAALYASTGINQGSNGTLAFWLLEVINAVTGNLDRSGGSLMGLGIFDYGKATKDADKDAFHSRIGNTRNFLGALPAALMADEILAPGEDQVRAMFVLSGNPLLTATNSDKLAKALEQLELLVSIDIVRNETAEYADYILPGTHFTERPDIPFSFVSLSGLSPQPWYQYTDRLVTPPGECRDELWIMQQLAKVCDAPFFGSNALQTLINTGEALGKLPLIGQRLTPMPERLLGLISRMGKQGGLRTLRKHPHGKSLPIIEGNSYLGRRVLTDDGKVHLAPPTFIELAERRLERSFEKAKQEQKQFRLITKRERFSHNSWTHNDTAFVKGKRQTNYLYLHPDDAERLGCHDGSMVEVKTAVGSVTLPAALSDDMMPGSVALPHGWGHQQASGLSVASKTRGVNANILASDRHDEIEPLSGMAQFTGFAVELKVLAEGSAVAVN